MLSRSLILIPVLQGPSVADVRQKNFLYKKNETMDILADEVINANDECR